MGRNRKEKGEKKGREIKIEDGRKGQVLKRGQSATENRNRVMLETFVRTRTPQ